MKSRSLSAGLLAVLALAAAPATAQEPVVFGKRAPSVGEKVQESKQVDMDMAMTVKVNGQVVQSVAMKQQEVEQSSYEVLATNGAAASKIKVAYGKMEESGSQGGAPPMTKTKPIAGKTYVVEATPGGLTVTTEAGAAPPPAEVEMVTNEQRDLGKVDPLTEIMPSGPMAIGTKIDLPPEKARAMFNDPNMNVESVSFTLTGVREGLAVFAVVMKVSGAPNPGMDLRLDLVGEMTMQPADSLPVSIHVSGPLTMTALQEQPGQRVDMNGAGTMTMKGDLSYSR